MAKAKKPVAEVDVLDESPGVVNADMRKFNRTEAMVTAAVNALAAITTIETKEQCDAALETLKEAKTVENRIEAKRKELVKPYNDEVKKINGYAKQLTEKIPPEVDRVKKEVVAYQKREEERAHAMRTAQRVDFLKSIGFEMRENGSYHHAAGCEIEKYALENMPDEEWVVEVNSLRAAVSAFKNENKAQDEIDDMFSTDDREPDVAETPALRAPTGSPAAEKVKGITRRWDFEITNAAEIPREYLMADEKKIREAIVNSGVRAIPGVHIFQKESLTIR